MNQNPPTQADHALECALKSRVSEINDCHALLFQCGINHLDEPLGQRLQRLLDANGIQPYREEKEPLPTI